MIKRVVIVLTVIFGSFIVLIVYRIFSTLFDAEKYVIGKLYENTGLLIPDKYVIDRSSGSYILEDSAYFHFKFDDEGYQELVKNVRSTPYFNDTLVLEEIIKIKWDPDDPRKIWRLNGMWVDGDSIYYYLSLESSHAEIGQTWIDKDAKLLKVNLEF